MAVHALCPNSEAKSPQWEGVEYQLKEQVRLNLAPMLAL